MKILNRKNEYEECRLDAITDRVLKACSFCEDLDTQIVDPVLISTKVCPQIVNGITTKELDNITVNICMNLSLTHPQFGILGSRIAVNNHQKNVNISFSEAMNQLYNFVDTKGNSSPKLNKKFIDTVNKYSKEFENMIVTDRDYNIDFFGFKTLERAYLLKNNDKILETAQYMWLRVAIGMWLDDLDKVKNTYDLLSTKAFTHATPTLFNCGTSMNNCISCFLLHTEDSVQGIFKTISDCASISKVAGGIGIHISNIRANKSYVRGTGGASDGVLPMLKVYNETAKYINQGNKRNGSFAVYTEPYHYDIEIFLNAKRNHGNEEERARDLFYALWIPDIFMRKVKNDEDWHLMCPDECPNLPDTYGEEFDNLYNKYISEGKYKKIIKARKLWDKIIDVQLETGMPYMCYKDHVNRKTNQQNIGTIKSSNLCVSPETRILTKKGYFPIKEFKDKEVEVWNGEEWSKTKVRQTGENQKLLHLKFSNDIELNCTEYHKFYIQINEKNIQMKAKDLKIGMKLIEYKLPNNEICNDITVVSVEDNNRYDDTYCFKEEKRGMGIFEGILTGNCSEINLYSDKGEYACCNLVSLRLQSYIIPNKNVNIYKESYVKIYTKQDCGYCKMAKALFIKNDIKFNEISLDDDELRHLFYDKYKVNTVPQIFIDKTLIGGFNELLENVRPEYDHEQLRKTVYTCVENLNKIIDINYYPTPETEKSNFRHRPIGIGVQGLANVFIEMWVSYDSDIARQLNKDIFETIYFAAMEKSCEMAKESEPYSTFKGSPLEKGIFQFDMWGVTPSDRWDWDTLKENVKKYGVRNSTLLALMPTASTAQILGSEECFQPITSNMYLRRTLAGEFIVINSELMNILCNMGIWDEEMKYRIMYHKGSISNITKIPKELRDIFKTAWEISQKSLIEMSADRGAYVCQSQSFNIFIKEPDPNILTKIHFKGWESGLKTGSYYIHSKPSTNSQNFTIEPKMEELFIKELLQNKTEDCEACGS